MKELNQEFQISLWCCVHSPCFVTYWPVDTAYFSHIFIAMATIYGNVFSFKVVSWFLFFFTKLGKSKGKNQALYYLYLEVVSITNSKSQSVPEDAQDTDINARSSEHLDLYSFSPRDLEFIVKFSEEHGSDVFRQILQSVCPSIYGHELVKGIRTTIAINLLVQSYFMHGLNFCCCLCNRFLGIFGFKDLIDLDFAILPSYLAGQSRNYSITVWWCSEAFNGSEQGACQRRYPCNCCWYVDFFFCSD